MTMGIKGRSLIEGIPKTITVDDSEIREALNESVAAIVSVSRATGGTDRSTTGGPPRLISDVLQRTSEARRFGGVEPSSRAGEQHVNGRSSTESRGVS